MTMAWVAVGTAVVGAAASYAGSKKQADALKKGSNMQMQMLDKVNAQQQPYIQSGYGAMGKLNTLLGIGGGGGGGGGGTPAPHAAPGSMGTAISNHMYRPTPEGGVKAMATTGPSTYGAPAGASNLPLRHILTMRAQNGDTEAARILGQV